MTQPTTHGKQRAAQGAARSGLGTGTSAGAGVVLVALLLRTWPALAENLDPSVLMALGGGLAATIAGVLGTVAAWARDILAYRQDQNGGEPRLSDLVYRLLSIMGGLVLAIGLSGCASAIRLGPPRWQLIELTLNGADTFCWNDARIMGMDLGAIGWGSHSCTEVEEAHAEPSALALSAEPGSDEE